MINPFKAIWRSAVRSWKGEENFWVLLLGWGAGLYIIALLLGAGGMGANHFQGLGANILYILNGTLGFVFIFIYPFIFSISVWRSVKSSNAPTAIVVLIIIVFWLWHLFWSPIMLFASAASLNIGLLNHL